MRAPARRVRSAAFSAIALRLLLLLTIQSAAPAHAHDLRGSLVLLDLGSRALDVELQLPLAALRTALGEPRAASSAPLLTSSELIAAYAQARFVVTTPDGLPFVSVLRGVAREHIDDGDALVVRLALRAPAQRSARSFVVHSDLIVHRVPTHDTYVLVRRDLWSGSQHVEPRLLGVLRGSQQTLRVERSDGSVWKGFAAAVRHGVRHIVDGTDHLLFLLMLLLPACLRATAGRWRTRKTLRQSTRHTFYVVTAFTLGHSVTLALGALSVVHIAVQWVEVAIALSILVSALHAVRPLLVGGETWLAASFGLVHGLAFASALAGVGVDGVTLLTALLGFNLGIELMQLCVVVLFVPWLFLLSADHAYGLFRGTFAFVAALLACNWTIERAWDVETSLSPWLDVLTEHAAWSLPAVITLALASRYARTSSSHA